MNTIHEQYPLALEIWIPYQNKSSTYGRIALQAKILPPFLSSAA